MRAIVEINKHDATSVENCTGLYLNDSDRKKHRGNIVSIANEKGCPVTDVTECYERILSELKQRARVPDYVDVFVARKVLAQLKIS